MKHLARFFDWLSEEIADAERKRREAYLAQATDHFDLERRMREIERATVRFQGW